MLQEINSRLSELQEALFTQESYRRRIDELESDIVFHKDGLRDLAEKLDSEEADVDELEGLSMRGMFLSVFGDKEKELDRERREYFAAWLKHDQLEETIHEMEKELLSLRDGLRTMGDIRSQRIALMKQKEEALLATDSDIASTLFRLAEERGELSGARKELDEASREGFILLEGLDSIINDLKRAAGWGTLDLLGGGIVATAVKHSKIDDARARIAGVQTQLNRFKREMTDVEMDAKLHIEIDGFTTFADFFFDGLIFDWIVQSHISKSLAQVENTRRSVSACLNQLSSLLKKNQSRDVAIMKERRALIERA